jgi:hypothetical protein
MTFPAKPTTRDLSDIPENKPFPSYDSSMAGGNMITEKNPHFAGRGSDSEAVHDVVMATMTDFGNQQSPPVLPGAEAEGADGDVGVDVHATGYSPASPRSWKELR